MCSCGSVVEHCVNSTKGCGFDSQGTHILIKKYIYFFYKSLWIKASAKCINVNYNYYSVVLLESLRCILCLLFSALNIQQLINMFTISLIWLVFLLKHLKKSRNTFTYVTKETCIQRISLVFQSHFYVPFKISKCLWNKIRSLQDRY